MEEYKYIIVDDLNEHKDNISKIVFDAVMSRKQNNEIPEVSFTVKHDLKCNKEGYEFLKEHIDYLETGGTGTNDELEGLVK